VLRAFEVRVGRGYALRERLLQVNYVRLQIPVLGLSVLIRRSRTSSGGRGLLE